MIFIKIKMTALKCNNLKWLSQCEKRYAKYVHMFIYVFYLFIFSLFRADMYL